MNKLFCLITLTLHFTCMAQGDKIKMYLELSLDTASKLEQMDEALKVGRELKANIAKLQKEQSQDMILFKLQEKLDLYEKQMYKTYGLIPRLNYVMVPTQGQIFQIVPLSEIGRAQKNGLKVPAKCSKINVKDKDDRQIQCLKIPVKKLLKGQDIQHFKEALHSAEDLRIKIADFKKRVKAKAELQENKKLSTALKQLEETLHKIESAMQNNFSVSPGKKYIFEPQKGLVYLILKEADLRKLAEGSKN